MLNSGIFFPVKKFIKLDYTKLYLIFCIINGYDELVKLDKEIQRYKIEIQELINKIKDINNK